MGQPVKVSEQPTQRHRGADPEDEHSFGAGRLPDLRQAVHDVCWLLDRGYCIASATKLAGDRYHLTRRQRIAVARCSCSTTAKERRQSHCVSPTQLQGQALMVGRDAFGRVNRRSWSKPGNTCYRIAEGTGTNTGERAELAGSTAVAMGGMTRPFRTRPLMLLLSRPAIVPQVCANARPGHESS